MKDELNLALLKRLRRLTLAYEKLSRAVPTAPEALKQAEKELKAVLAILNDPEVSEEIDSKMGLAATSPSSSSKGVASYLGENAELFVRSETRAAQPFGLSRVTVSHAVESYTESTTHGPVIRSTVEIRTIIEAGHEAYVSQLESSRNAPRRDKKRRKRQLGLGSYSMITGVAIVVTNLQWLPSPQGIASCSVGSSSILTGLRDIIGTAE